MNQEQEQNYKWVKASDELPDRDNGYVVELFGGVIHRKLWSQLDRERSIKIWTKEKVLSWLKPVESQSEPILQEPKMNFNLLNKKMDDFFNDPDVADKLQKWLEETKANETDEEKEPILQDNVMGGIWVKASERLPEKRQNCFVKVWTPLQNGYLYFSTRLYDGETFQNEADVINRFNRDKVIEWLCVNYYKLITGDGYSYIPFVSNFKFYRMRATNDLFIDSDGITGCFVSGGGYAQEVTHYKPLPAPPNP